MYLLRKLGWRSVLPDKYYNVKQPLEFLLVFDDGYACIHHNALPILRECDYRALLFIPTGYIGRWNDWDHHLLWRRFRHLDLQELSDLVDAGWIIGSHTVSHISLTELSNIDLKNELIDSRRALEDSLGREVHWVSFPFGRYNRRVLDAALDCGYTGAVVPVLKRISVPQGFTVWSSDAVYRWDSDLMASSRLQRSRGYRIGCFLRMGANWLNGGTLVWKKLFPG